MFFRMIVKRETGIEERQLVKEKSKMGTKKSKMGTNLTWTIALSVALFSFSRYATISLYSLPVLIRFPFPVLVTINHCPNDNLSLLANKKVIQNFIKTATSAKDNCSRISRRRPPKCKELVFAHGRWWLSRVQLLEVLSEEKCEHVEGIYCMQFSG